MKSQIIIVCFEIPFIQAFQLLIQSLVKSHNLQSQYQFDSIKIMKYLLTVSLFVVLISSLGVRQARKAVPESHQVITSNHLAVTTRHQAAISGHQSVNQTHQSVEGKHQQAQAQVAAAVVGAIPQLFNMIEKISQVTCSATGFTRSNLVKIYNDLPKQIRVSGTYQQDGNLFKHGSIYIPPKNVTIWEFVKKDFYLTGTSGIIILDLPKNSLVIFFHNPVASWNYAGFCLQEKMKQWPNRDQRKAVYKRLHKPASNNLPSNCRIADNRETKNLSFQRRLQLKTEDHTINANVKYQFVNKGGMADCYNQEMIIIVG